MKRLQVPLRRLAARLLWSSLRRGMRGAILHGAFELLRGNRVTSCSRVAGLVLPSHDDIMCVGLY
jgi:hypothetical protein